MCDAWCRRRLQMSTLWTVKAEEGGKERFGDDYVDVWDISRIHFAAASQPGCDHVSMSKRTRPPCGVCFQDPAFASGGWGGGQHTIGERQDRGSRSYRAWRYIRSPS